MTLTTLRQRIARWLAPRPAPVFTVFVSPVARDLGLLVTIDSQVHGVLVIETADNMETRAIEPGDSRTLSMRFLQMRECR